jgi:purine-binding chemotaxis protein CheW
VHPQGQDVLLFEIGGRRFGLPVFSVQELVRAVTIVPLPSAPATAEGVMNLRGRVIPVLDLRGPLGLPSKEVEPADLLVIARSRGELVALRVDRALELVTSGGRAAEGAPPDASESTGVVMLGDGLAPVLDAQAFLADAEWEALQRALMGRSPPTTPEGLR